LCPTSREISSIGTPLSESKRDERVTQLARRPLLGVDPGCTPDRGAEVAADVRRVQRRPVARREDEVEVNPTGAGQVACPVLHQLVLGEDVVAAGRQRQRTPREPRLGIPGRPDRPEDRHRWRHGRIAVGPPDEVEVLPGQRAHLLGPGAREQRHDDVRLHPRADRRVENGRRLGEGELLGLPAGAPSDTEHRSTTLRLTLSRAVARRTAR